MCGLCLCLCWAVEVTDEPDDPHECGPIPGMKSIHRGLVGMESGGEEPKQLHETLRLEDVLIRNLP